MANELAGAEWQFWEFRSEEQCLDLRMVAASKRSDAETHLVFWRPLCLRLVPTLTRPTFSLHQRVVDSEHGHVAKIDLSDGQQVVDIQAEGHHGCIICYDVALVTGQ